MWKMRHEHCKTWSMARKLKIIENEKYTCRTWIMARKVKYFENETQTLFDLEVC